MKKESINKLRKIMGTLPDDQPPREDKIYVGVENIRVKLVDYTRNPYRASEASRLY